MLLHPRSKSFLVIIAMLLALQPAPESFAKSLDLGQATVQELNAAFAAGAVTSEKLVQVYLARIQAYDKQGPKLHGVISVNPKALEQARALDAERKAKGPRSPLHGIPILLK